MAPSRWSEWPKTGQQTHGLQKLQIFFRLLWEDRQLNIDAGAFTVRPPAAPTTAGQYEGGVQGPRSALGQDGPKRKAPGDR
jgi:hypothetical protein